jgi:acetylglutamate kinase
MQEIIKKAQVLIEALPYIHAFRKKTIVIKYGGSILSDENIRRGVLEDMVFLSLVGLRPVLVHGGGMNITERMKSTGKKAHFVEGIRVTDEETLKIVGEELESLNHTIVKEINALKGHAVGLKGQHGVVEVKKKPAEMDLGYVGEITGIATEQILDQLKKEAIPVISPMGIGKDKHVYNVNADETASAVGVALAAEKFVLLTNVKGVMRHTHDEESFISTLTSKEARSMIKEKIIQEGMIPKIEACITALEGGVKKTHIINARIHHALLLEIFTDKGIGTEIIK